MLLEQVQPSPWGCERVRASVVTATDIEVAIAPGVVEWNNTTNVSPTACAPAYVKHGGKHVTAARGWFQNLTRAELLKNFVAACVGGGNAGAASYGCSIDVKRHASPHENAREKTVV